MVGVFHDLAFEGGEADERRKAGENFAARVLDDQNTEPGSVHLRKDPGGGGIVEGGEIAHEAPSFRSICGQTQEGGEIAIDPVSAPQGPGVDGVDGLRTKIPLTDGEAVAGEYNGVVRNVAGQGVDQRWLRGGMVGEVMEE